MGKEAIILLAVFCAVVLLALFGGQPTTEPMVYKPVSVQKNTKTAGASSNSNTDSKCQWNGITLKGKVEFVDSFADIKIKYVSSFGDIKVQFVNSFPDDCGEWQEVSSFGDFSVQVVDSFPDLEVQKVSSFPGMN